MGLASADVPWASDPQYYHQASTENVCHMFGSSGCPVPGAFRNLVQLQIISDDISLLSGVFPVGMLVVTSQTGTSLECDCPASLPSSLARPVQSSLPLWLLSPGHPTAAWYQNNYSMYAVPIAVFWRCPRGSRCTCCSNFLACSAALSVVSSSWIQAIVQRAHRPNIPSVWYLSSGPWSWRLPFSEHQRLLRPVRSFSPHCCWSFHYFIAVNDSR